MLEKRYSRYKAAHSQNNIAVDGVILRPKIDPHNGKISRVYYQLAQKHSSLACILYLWHTFDTYCIVGTVCRIVFSDLDKRYMISLQEKEARLNAGCHPGMRLSTFSSVESLGKGTW